jgi:hypothetical protein
MATVNAPIKAQTGGADLTFATPPAQSPQGECQIQGSTGNIIS